MAAKRYRVRPSNTVVTTVREGGKDITKRIPAGETVELDDQEAARIPWAVEPITAEDK
jgi:hypothetical protein